MRTSIKEVTKWLKGAVQNQIKGNNIKIKNIFTIAKHFYNRLHENSLSLQYTDWRQLIFSSFSVKTARAAKCNVYSTVQKKMYMIACIGKNNFFLTIRKKTSVWLWKCDAQKTSPAFHPITAGMGIVQFWRSAAVSSSPSAETRGDLLYFMNCTDIIRSSESVPRLPMSQGRWCTR